MRASRACTPASLPQAALTQAADDQPFADAALVDAQQIGAEETHQRIDRSDPGDDDVGPLGA